MVGFIKIGILFLLAGIFGEEKLVYKGELNEASTEVQNRDGWDNFTDHYVVGKNPTTPNVYEVKNYTLGVKNELSKSGEIDFSGLSELEVIEGENVQIVADSFTGYVFSHWEIDGVNVGGGHEYEFKMPSKDINVVGKFVKQAEPTVKFVSPQNNLTISESIIDINLEILSPDSEILFFEFLVNNQVVKVFESNDLNFIWDFETSGSFVLNAIVYDNVGNKVNSSPITVNIQNENILPEVSITSPANGTEYAIGESVTITADATDADGAITKVDFYVNGSLIGSDNTAPYTLNWNATDAGSFELTAVATDDRNGKTTSASVTVTVIADNTLPEVSITSPANGSEYAIGEAVTITADATDADGAITKVDFYVNGGLIGSDNTAPYTINWNAAEAGNFELTAVATDDRNGKTTSASVTVTVIADNTLPEVSITSPANGSEYAIGEAVTITADATDADGAITKVDFYINGSLIGSDNTAPYTINWNATEAGNFELTAVATDDRGGETTSAAVTVTVIADNILPEVSITSPANGTEYAIGESVTITADATDADGAITKVDFYVNGGLIGSDNTAPFTANWNAAEAGNFELTAVATDDRNGKTTSAAVTVTVIADNILPEVSITSPSNGIEYAIGEAVTITADATDADGAITKVDFYVNGSLIGSDNTAPFTANWNATEAGSFELTAVATDDRNGKTTSAAVTVTVIADNILPEVSVTSPANGTEYAIGEAVTITADATDADGTITKVDFYVNGSLIGSDNTAPYTANWNATEAGSFELTAVATDDRGGENTSAAVTVTVIADNILPEVSITSPANGSEYAIGKSVTITADATDADGAITKVDFYVNGSLIGSDNTAPYTINWNATEAGNFELTAVATDDRGGETTSAAVTITVIADNILPEVSITSPTNGIEYAIGKAVNITANATDADGAITKVDFYVNGSLIGTSSDAPFTANWNAAEAGNFELTAVATDDRNGKTTSAAVTVTVIADNILPEVSITSPSNGTEYAIGEAVNITANATDADGAITKVDFYVNGSLIGSDNTAPFTANWNAAEAGNFELTAVATDDRGGETTSVAVPVTVIADNVLPEVSITSPAEGSEYAIGEAVTITADATDADGTITKVDFYVNGSLIGSDNTAPYTANWNATEAGSFELTAVATDDRGGENTSAAVTVTVIADNILPEVSITSPANGSEYAIGKSVTITADATDADGAITKVDFYVNGSLIGSDNTAPYTINWNATEAGNFELTAVATDDRGGETTSAAVTVTVIADNILPEVSITSPANGIEYAIGEAVTITADATDADGAITKVDFYVNGSLIGSDNTAPFTANWNAAEAGNFELTAVATDDRNGKTTSAAVTVTVIADNILPEVSITSPAASSEYAIGESVTITADATDADGAITKVDFYVNGGLIGSDNAAPFTANWNAAEAGNFELTAVATDDRNGKTTSAAVTVTVIADNILPEVSITSPAAGSEYAIGEAVTIIADATDADGTITKVDFYVNGSLIGSDNSAPFTANWNAAEAGSFELTAVATDDRNGKTTSATVTVTVIADNILPEVSITSPANGIEYAIGEAVTITADATDADGEIGKVDFYVNGSLIGSDNTAPYTINWNAAEAGNFELTAVATDDRGGETTSAAVTVTVIADNILPEVSITSPAASSEYAIGESVTITADATDADGAITKVDFYVNGGLIGSDNTAPFTANWNAAEAGNFELTAVATDDRNGKTTSAAVTVTVIADNILPEVSITSPAAGSEYAIGESVTITADATDADGTITKVDFYVNGSLIGSDNSAPFTANWNAAEAGSFEFTAVATDDRNGKTTSAAVTVTVIADNVLPEVSITSPAAGTEYAIGEAVTIIADATDADGTITKVDFYVNGGLIRSDNTAPFTANWNATEAGNFELTAVATDDRNGKTTSAAVTVTVIADNILPEVSITSPANGTEYAIGESVTITADATDADGAITKVDFYVNGSLIGSDNTAPFTANWNATGSGNFELTAVATDDRNGETTSAAVTVTVIADNVLPEVSITSPAAGTEYAIGEAVTITADATDADGAITKVDFYVNGSLIGSDNTAPYTINWNAIEAGNFELTAVATDDRNGKTTSAAVTVTVIADNILPEVSITSPANGSEYAIGESVTITADATDADGSITKVDFYVNGSLIGTSSDAPFTANWNATEAGNFELTAVATDDRGGETTSAAVIVTVVENQLVKPLSIKITSPSQNEVFARNAMVNFEVEIESDSEIEKVEYFRNNILIGASEEGNFSLSWRAMNMGNLNIRATVTDIEGQIASSEVLRIRVENNVAPEVRILSPNEGEEIILGTPIEISAEAFDSDGSIDYVEFYANDKLIGVSNEEPYSIIWTEAIRGPYSFTAKAFDDRGASSTSAPVSVVIINNEEEPDSEDGESEIPEVIIISPGFGQEFESGTEIPLIIMLDGDASLVEKVEYFANGQLIGVSNQDPFNFNWIASMTGEIELVAVAYGFDNEKRSISEAQMIKIVQPQTNFRIVDPIRDAVFIAGSDILIRVSLPMISNEVEKVEYFRGNQKIGETTQDPYSFVWANVSQGQYSLVARLVFKDGTSELSIPVRISVIPRNNGSIRIKASKSEIVEGASLELNVETNDVSKHVDLVDIYMNDELIGQLDEEPYMLKLDELPVGEHKFVARGKSKNAKSQVYYSEEINVRVLPRSEYNIDIPDILLEIKVGPNPTSDFLNLIFENLDSDESYEFTVQIVAMNGVVHDVYTFVQNGKVSTLDVNHLKNGAYMLNLFHKNRKIANKRFIKRR